MDDGGLLGLALPTLLLMSNETEHDFLLVRVVMDDASHEEVIRYDDIMVPYPSISALSLSRPYQCFCFDGL